MPATPDAQPAASPPARRTTAIEWTDHTWNPWAGCARVSEGCRHCYAERLAGRLREMGQPTYQGLTTGRGNATRWTNTVNRSTHANFRKPLKWRDPAKVFVNSMSDFWHPAVKPEWQVEAFAIMKARPHLTYQILTKRPENVLPQLARLPMREVPPNVWLGATVEDARVGHRLDLVRAFPAETRFVSIEPMVAAWDGQRLDGIAWAITGGESGPGARDCDPDWVRDARDRAGEAGAAFFHKQWGRYANNPLVREAGRSPAAAARLDPPDNGKGGALLDGRLHRAFPAGQPI